MVLQINRQRNARTDRKGNVKDVSFALRFRMLLDSEEQSSIAASNLGWHILFKSTERTFAHELIDADVDWTLPTLELALSIQQSMVDNSRGFDALVRKSATFDGHHEVDLRC